MTLGKSSSAGSGLRNWRKILVPMIAVVSTAAGIVVVRTPRPDVGWFAYAPLANEPFSSNQLILLDGSARMGYALIAAGLLALAFWAGYQAALRRSGRKGQAGGRQRG